jgi:hypothetical protein
MAQQGCQAKRSGQSQCKPDEALWHNEFVDGECMRQRVFVRTVPRFGRHAEICGFPREENHEETQQGVSAVCNSCAAHPSGRFCCCPWWHGTEVGRQLAGDRRYRLEERHQRALLARSILDAGHGSGELRRCSSAPAASSPAPASAASPTASARSAACTAASTACSTSGTARTGERKGDLRC